MTCTNERNFSFFLSKTELKLNDISEILVNQGPGSFSSLRSSLATAKGSKFSKKFKIVWI